MAVQLLETWLLKEQEKIQNKYRELNQITLLDPDIIFIGDSIIEYYPLQELLGPSKIMVNRGIRGYQTGLLLDNLDAHLYGGAVDQIVLLIGTNDIGKEVELEQTLHNFRLPKSSFFLFCQLMKVQSISRQFISVPMRKSRCGIKLIKTLPLPICRLNMSQYLIAC